LAEKMTIFLFDIGLFSLWQILIAVLGHSGAIGRNIGTPVFLEQVVKSWLIL
jgi:hypothetical protein